MMGNLVVTYPDGRQEMVAYEQLFDAHRDPPWDQRYLQEWRRLNCVMHCNCRPGRPIRMFLRNHPIYKDTVQILYSEANVEHANGCFKFQEPMDEPVHTVETKPGVVHTTITDAEGTREVVRVTLADDFFKEEAEEAGEDEGGVDAGRDVLLNRRRAAPLCQTGGRRRGGASPSARGFGRTGL